MDNDMFDGNDIYQDTKYTDPAQQSDKLIDRKNEYDTVFSTAIKPFLEGQKHTNILLQGPTGTGKTAILNQLKKEVDQVQKDNIIALKHNGRDFSTYQLFNRIAEETGLEKKNNISTEDLITEVSDHLAEEDLKLVLMVDSMIEDDAEKVIDILESVKSQHICLIAASNRKEHQEVLENNSGIEMMVVPLEEYSIETITDTLMHRQSEALNNEYFDRGDMLRIAEYTKSIDSGNMWMAMHIFKDACRNLYKADDFQKALKTAVKDALGEKVVDRSKRTGAFQDKHFGIVYIAYTLTSDNGEGLTTKQVYDKYCDICEDNDVEPRTKTYIYRKLEKMSEEGVLRKESERRGDTNTMAYKMPYGFEEFQEYVEKTLAQNIGVKFDIETEYFTRKKVNKI